MEHKNRHKEESRTTTQIGGKVRKTQNSTKHKQIETKSNQQIKRHNTYGDLDYDEVKMKRGSWGEIKARSFEESKV